MERVKKGQKLQNWKDETVITENILLLLRTDFS